MTTTFLNDVDDETLASLVEEINDYLYEKGDHDDTLGLHNFFVIG